MSSPFPAEFLWGAATAAYQIEGGAAADGKGPSIWDIFAAQPGKTWRHQTGAIATDHYHRWQEDIALLQEIGLHAYRLSLSWPRILPQGSGAVNQRGVDFYDRLIDALLSAGIEPYITLYHWDLPHALHLRGGWLNAESPAWFADYARLAAEHFGDRVRNWMTFNEPQIFIQAGYVTGVHAPGLILPAAEVLLAAHHVLLAHGMGVQSLRAHSRLLPRIGMASCGIPVTPASDSSADVEAARRHMFENRTFTMESNSWWLDPLFKGGYPDDGLKLYEKHLPLFGAGDFALIAQPLDFFAVNFYFGPAVRAGADGTPERLDYPMGYPQTGFSDWPVTPGVLYWGPRFCYERYGVPIYITENGCSNPDRISLDGKVHDPQRIDFMQRYLNELGRAIADGIDIRGYFYWSLLDNIEWAEGVKARFGLAFVDFPGGRRLLKDSAHWYKAFIAGGARLNIGRP